MSYVAAFGLRGILCMHFVYFCSPVISGEIHNWVVRKISTGKERTDCSVSLYLCQSVFVSLSLVVCLTPVTHELTCPLLTQYFNYIQVALWGEI